MIWAVFAGCFLGRIGGAHTSASAKVKDAIGRIGIFQVSIYLCTGLGLSQRSHVKPDLVFANFPVYLRP